MDSAQLDKLERLAKAATPGPWYTLTEMCEGVGCDPIISKQGEICDFVGNMHNPYGDRSYIVSACNSVPELIAENRALQERVRELEKALIELVKIEVSLPECAVCWERDRCTDRSHGDNCLAVGYIVDMAKEAAKEAGK